MATYESSKREPAHTIHWRRYGIIYQIVGGVVLVIIGIWIGSILFENDSGYGSQLYLEVLGVLVTIFVIERMNRHRDKNTLQKRLLREAASPSNGVAKAAISWMRDEGWLEGEDSLLQGAYLWEANLEGASLNSANMARAYLGNADLSGGYLARANLSGADMLGTDLSGCDMVGANLSRVQLRFANLEGAYLGDANLIGASLLDANLKHASLEDVYWGYARMDSSTVLPDGSKWQQGTDMSRFTDPTHEDFWQPEWVRLRDANSNQTK